MDESIETYMPEMLKQEREIIGGRDLDIRGDSPLTLAFIGDAVFGLYIRTVVVAQGNTAPGKLHSRCSELVKAGTQAAMIRGIADTLTEEEKQVYRRGRNAQASSRAKNATMSDYRHATGLEALFGYLYLTGQGDRMTELAEQCLNYYDEQILTKERKQKHEI